jgi:hypothetical protein
LMCVILISINQSDELVGGVVYKEALSQSAELWVARSNPVKVYEGMKVAFKLN